MAKVNVVSDFKGVYARIARQLNVSPSMVSRVARGHRNSPRIAEALRRELKDLMQKLNAVEG
jgi:DNA-binding LacI/PurR family transcriptional regulator